MFLERTVAVIIYPMVDKAGEEIDNWLSDPPFDGCALSEEAGYMVATTKNKSAGYDDFYLLTDRFLDLTNVTNDIDFMFKTESQIEENNISNGIGGYAKLKDFSITLVDKGDLDKDKIIGRVVEVRSYEGSIITPDVSGLFETHFKGVIYKINKPFTDTIELQVQGLMSNNNPRINGEPYIDIDGNVQHTFIIIGDTSLSSLVKLDKRRGAQGVQLGFDSSKYALKNLYIKEKTLDEFFPVTSGFTVTDNKVYFTSGDSILLKLGITADDRIISVIDYTIIGMRASSDYTFKNYCAFQGKGSGRYRWLKLIEQTDSKSALYSTTSSFIFPDTLSYVLKWYKTDYIWFNDTQNLAGAVSGENEIKSIWVEREPMFPDFQSLDTGYLYPESVMGSLSVHLYIPAELKDKWDYFFYDRKYIDVIPDLVTVRPKENVVSVLKIEEEEIAVLAIHENLDYKVLTVSRGFSGTEPAAHTVDKEVFVLNSDYNFAPKVKIVKDLKYVLRSDFHNQISSSFNYSEWVENSPDDPYKWPFQFNYPDLQNWLFISWDLPDISGYVSNNPVIKSKISIEKINDLSWQNQLEGDAWCNLLMGVAMQPNSLYLPSTEPDSFKGLATFVNSRNLVGCQWNRSGGTWEIHDDPKVDDLKTAMCYGGGRYLSAKFAYAEKDITTPEQYPILKNMGLQTWSIHDGELYTNPNFDDSVFKLRGSWFLNRQRDNTVGFFEYSWAIKYFFYEMGVKNEITFQTEDIKPLLFFDYDELKNTNFALRFLKLDNMNFSFSGVCNIDKLQLTVRVKAPIPDNEWYGKMNLKGVNLSNSIPSHTVYLGDNGSLYLYEKDKKFYLFGESDQRPFVVYNLSLNGYLTLIDEITLAQQPTMGSGRLALIEEDDAIAKIQNTATSYHYLKSNYTFDDDFPDLENNLYSVNSIKNTPVGDETWETEAFRIYYDKTDGYIKVYRKQEILVKNPVDVLKILLINYALHQEEILDDNPLDPFDTNYSFGLVRRKFNSAGYSATIIIEEEVNANKVVSEFCENFGLVLFESNEGILKLADLYPPPEEEITYLEELPISAMLYREDRMPAIVEEKIQISQLVTGMNLRWKPLGDKFQEEIKNDDWEANDTNIYNLLQKVKNNYTFNDSQIALNLKYTSDKKTALYCAYLKLLFHSYPARILEIECHVGYIKKDLGTWFTIPINDFIPDTLNKQYLLISNNSYEPLKNERAYTTLRLFEFDWNERITQIQEIPEETLVHQYNETDTDTDSIQEVTDYS